MASNQVPVAIKARQISEKWGIPFEEVREIQRKGIAECSFEELKIRYDDPELGQFPEWFDTIQVERTIRTAIRSKWVDILKPDYSEDDIFVEVWMKMMMASKSIRNIGKDKYLAYIYKLAANRVSHFIGVQLTKNKKILPRFRE